MTYTRDALGRIANKTERVGAEAVHTFSYSYDLARRLSDMGKDGNPTARYAYDANGNRLAGPGLTSSPAYDAQDRLLSYGACTYSYKPDGSLQTKSCPGATTTYDYDDFGNLRGATLPDGRAISYLIDGANRRIGKKVGPTLVERFLYRTQLQPVAWLNPDNTVKARFVYASRLNVPEYMVLGGTTYRIITDQVGSVRLVVDAATGTVAQRMDYDEFGVVLADSNPGFQPFGYAGGLYDRDTGLVRFGARDYDAGTGTWTAKDPLRFGGGLLNLYGYVDGDPINRADSTGLWVGGIGGSLGGHLILWGGDAGVFVVRDGHGNEGIYVDWDMRLGLGLSVGKGPTGFFYPNMDNIDQLNGPTVGGGIDTPLACVQGLKNPTSLVPGSPRFGGLQASTGVLGASAYLLGGSGMVIYHFPRSR